MCTDCLAALPQPLQAWIRGMARRYCLEQLRMPETHPDLDGKVQSLCESFAKAKMHGRLSEPMQVIVEMVEITMPDAD